MRREQSWYNTGIFSDFQLWKLTLSDEPFFGIQLNPKASKLHIIIHIKLELIEEHLSRNSKAIGELINSWIITAKPKVLAKKKPHVLTAAAEAAALHKGNESRRTIILIVT